MTNTVVHGLPRWSLAVPPLALVVLVLSWGRDLGAVLLILVCAGLGAAVIAAVHHAEVVAHRVGEPFGTLILALAVTVIEVALIVTLMASGGDKAASLARDTVFAAVMITCNGILGLSLVVGSLRHRTQNFRVHASGSALAVMVALVTLSLVLPTFTTSTPGPTFSGAQLAFAGVVSLVMYGVFVFVQTVRHRDYFLPVEPSPAAVGTAGANEAEAAASGGPTVAVGDGGAVEGDEEETHAAAPSGKVALSSLGLLFLCLVAVVGLAKTVSPKLESAVESAGAVASIWLSGPLVLGLGGKELVLFALTVVICMLTLATGRATLLQGVVHLMVFCSFVFLAVSP